MGNTRGVPSVSQCLHQGFIYNERKMDYRGKGSGKQGTEGRKLNQTRLCTHFVYGVSLTRSPAVQPYTQAHTEGKDRLCPWCG